MNTTPAAPFPITGGDYTWDGTQLVLVVPPATPIAAPASASFAEADTVTSLDGRRKPRSTDQ
jgi:hypothetical protein